MRIGDFDLYYELLQKESGLFLTQEQGYLIESRLTPIAKKWGYPSLSALTLSLRGVPSPALIENIIEAMTFRDTAFFYESASCEAFRGRMLPYLAAKRKKSHPVRIWSAACSTGQEPYTLAISVFESRRQMPHHQVEILASDIAGPYLEEARRGRYTQVEMQRGLPVRLLLKHGTQQGRYWQLNDNIRKMVQFDKVNLLDDLDTLGTFDIIFCRNVLNYFSPQAGADVLDRVAKQLAPDGFMVLGETEAPPKTGKLRPIENCPGLYVHAKSIHHENERASVAER